MTPKMASRRLEPEGRHKFWLAIVSAKNRHAAAGTSQRSDRATPRCAAAFGKRRRLSFGEGRRGCQERNRFFSRFISFSFIIGSFKAEFHFLQTVTVAACGGIRRNIQNLTNLFESAAMPDLEH